MVDYQGPEVLRELVTALDVPIFNRIQRISYVLSDVNKIPLGKTEVARLSELNEISVVKKGKQPISTTEAKTIGDLVPACQLVSVKQSKNQVDVKLNRLACCSP